MQSIDASKEEAKGEDERANESKMSKKSILVEMDMDDRVLLIPSKIEGEIEYSIQVLH